MAHSVILKQFASEIVEATDILSTAEANIAANVWSSQKVSAVNAAKDALMDTISDMKADLSGATETFKDVCDS